MSLLDRFQNLADLLQAEHDAKEHDGMTPLENCPGCESDMNRAISAVEDYR